MKKYTLKNGLTIIFEKKDTKTVSLQATIKVGSDDENIKIAGISHFVEHMLFEGTKKRATNQIIANEIERLGGDLNAYTTNERTAYYVKVPKNHFGIALDILSDIVQNPTFTQWAINKERNIILKEINMVTDQPRFHQWIVFYKTLFKKHPAKNPTYGTIEAVKNMTRSQLLNYYNKYYFTQNTIITIVGNVKNPIHAVRKAFNNYQPGKRKQKKYSEPKNKKQSTIEYKKILNSYMVLGYKTATRLHPDSYVLDVITAIFSRGQTGRIVEEIRTKRGLSYEVNVHHDPSLDFGVFAVHLGTDKKNLKKAENIIVNEFSKLKKIPPKELSDAKGYLEGKNILDSEDTHNVADELSFWQLTKDAHLEKTYLQKIRKVTSTDIARVSKKYFTKNYTKVILQQK